MRLSWVRALPPRLWGGSGAPQVTRGLCQRPARDPSEGVTPSPATPKPQHPQGRVPTEGVTPRGGTAETLTWHRPPQQRQDENRDPQPWGSLGGDTPRGGPSRGDTPWSDTSRGGTSRGDPSGSRSGTSCGGTSRGDPSSNELPRGGTSRGDPSGSRGGTSWGDTSRGDPSGGDTSKTLPQHHSSHKTHDHQHDHDHQEATGDGEARGPAAFLAALQGAEKLPPGRGGGRLALVEAALAAMPALGVERSLSAYNALLRLLPRGPWVPRGPVQRLLFPFPRQQECGLQVLEQMERYGVMPDAETQFLLLGVFGPRSRPMRKLQRMMYWLPRFRHLDPHPLPPQLPPPGLAAAHLGLRRIANDPDARITVLQRPVPDTGGDEGSVQPYIVSLQSLEQKELLAQHGPFASSQSPEQKELLAQHGPSRPVFVEGPFPLWLRRTRLSYFVLRGDPLPPHLRNPPPDPERSFYFPLYLELDLERGPWDDEEFDVDEVEEGPVFALCMAGSGDRHTLGRWISGLQEENPVLGSTPVIFRLTEEGDPHAGPPEGAQTPQLGTGTPPVAELEPPEGQGRGGGWGEPQKSTGE